MALSREQKVTQVAETAQLLGDAKMSVFAAYAGLSVADMQALRRDARTTGTTIKIVKNRLFKLAASQVDALKEADLSHLTGQLLYAFNTEDEVGPAQVLAKFARTHPSLQLIGGIENSGLIMDETDIKAFAALPSKEQLRGQLVGTLGAPLSGFVNVVSGNLRGVLNVLSARAQTI